MARLTVNFANLVVSNETGEHWRSGVNKWVKSLQPEQVVMESSGIYWKSPYAALEQIGIIPLVVNARHVKNVPGRKTDIADAQWLATLARAGLTRMY